MEALKLHFDVDGDDFTTAGEASGEVKRALRKMHFPQEVVRKTAICMYEGEINLVIHGGGGYIDVTVEPDKVTMVLTDHGPGIPDIEAAMREGWSTASHDVREKGFGAGMGLPNMKRYSDSIQIDTEIGVGTTVTMVVDVPQA